MIVSVTRLLVLLLLFLSLDRGVLYKTNLSFRTTAAVCSEHTERIVSHSISEKNPRNGAEILRRICCKSPTIFVIPQAGFLRQSAEVECDNTKPPSRGALVTFLYKVPLTLRYAASQSSRKYVRA